MKKYGLFLLFIVALSSLSAARKKTTRKTHKNKKNKDLTGKHKALICQVCEVRFANKQNKLKHMDRYKHFPLRFYRVHRASLVLVKEYRSLWLKQEVLDNRVGTVTRAMQAEVDNLRDALNKPEK